MSSTPNISVSSTGSSASAGSADQPSLQTFAALGLSADQRTALRSILAAAKQQITSPTDLAKGINAVLTPAQQQTMAARTPAARPREQADQPSTPAAMTPAASTPAVSPAAAPGPRPAGTAVDAAANVRAQAAAQYARISALLHQVRSTDAPSAME
jgi:hypothetical protein